MSDSKVELKEELARWRAYARALAKDMVEMRREMDEMEAKIHHEYARRRQVSWYMKNHGCLSEDGYVRSCIDSPFCCLNQKD